MAIKKTQMYRRNLDGTETDLNPLTESQYVLMENGQTVQEVLSDRDSDKYTPVITNSSSTFKVGQGDNVDLSSSMKEGAYDSCVLKGKTMVNCIQEPSSKDIVLPYAFEDGRYVTINDTKESGALGIELKGQTLVNLVPKMDNTGNSSSSVYVTEAEIKINNDITNHRQYYWMSDEVLKKFKTNTKYTIIANITKNTLASSFTIINSYAGTNGDIAASVLRVPVGFTGRFVGVFTTLSDFTGRGRLGFTTGTGNEGELTMKNDMVILEGDWTNKELPFDNFFTGMVGCKMPILSTVGKNFFNINGYSTKNQYASINGNTITVNAPTTFSNTVYTLTGLKEGELYRVSLDKTGAGEFSIRDTNASSLLYVEKEEGHVSRTFTYEKGATIRIGNRQIVNSEVSFANIQIEHGSTETAHESYKSSILSLPEEVVLRSLPNGVCDTFNTRTGVYTQRIGDDTFIGASNENWRTPNNYTTGDTMPFRITKPTMQGNGRVVPLDIICDKMKIETPRNAWGNDGYDGEGLSHGTGKGEGVDVRILKSKLPTEDVAGFKQWLSQNPIRVQYQLHTPIITKVNLSSTLKSWNTTTHIYSEIPENSLYPILSHSNPTYPVILKPSTKYSIVANSYSNGHTNAAINFNLGGATASTTVGNRVTTITTPSTLSNELLTMSGRGNKLNNVMVIEGDVVGDEPYFEGICDVKSPILSNTGKNLINALNCSARMGAIILSKEQNCITFKTPNAWGGLVYHLYLKPNTTYTFSFEGDSVDTRGYVRYKTGMSDWSGGYGGSNKYTFTTDGLGVVMFTIESATVRDSVTVKNIMIEEATTKNLYEPHKSNTTTFDQKDGKTIVLRSLPNGVCDTLNVETGEYVQRIRGKVFDGKDNGWQVLPYPPHDNDTHYQFKYWFGENLIGGDLWNNAQSILANTLPSASGVLHWSSQGKYGIGGDRSHFMITWEKSSSPFHDVATLNAWLQANPITVQYQLATPIVSTVDVQGFPYAYTNGHVQLSSGYNGQSLTPKVEYSLSANKTGQINSNSKIVMKHQKQLDDFEAMMLTSMVQSAYDKAILQFDYEMRMMSLGGE